MLCARGQTPHSAYRGLMQDSCLRQATWHAVHAQARDTSRPHQIQQCMLCSRTHGPLQGAGSVVQRTHDARTASHTMQKRSVSYTPCISAQNMCHISIHAHSMLAAKQLRRQRGASKNAATLQWRTLSHTARWTPAIPMYPPAFSTAHATAEGVPAGCRRLIPILEGHTDRFGLQ